MNAYCPCGFPPPWTLGLAFGSEFYRRHRAHHLATFPDVDEGTRRNLNDLINNAQGGQP